MKTKLSILALAVITLFSWAFVGCNSPKPYRTCEGIIWSTTYHVTYASNALLDDSIRTVMQQVDHSVSAFNPRSIISAINRNDTSAVADTILRRVFEESIRINRFSHGAFDPTVGPLVDLWGFGPSNATHSDSIQAPSKAAIDSVLMLVGMADCELLSDGHVRKKHPGTQFNFSAIAKGYACDLVAGCSNVTGWKTIWWR